MNKNSNVYVILYSLVMVIVVAVLLAFTSQSLKDIKKNNENIDKMRQILGAVQVATTNDTAVELYNTTIVNAFMVDANGEVVAGSEGTGVEAPAFTARLSDIPTGSEFPVYVANVEGATKYVLGLQGAGLWGPIWGYIALNDKGEEVFGINLSHASETPGLGAEIATPHFTSQFVAASRQEPLRFFKEGQFKSVEVVKPGKVSLSGADYVDGVSGGTITSKGVSAMLHDSVEKYVPFLTKLNAK